MLAGRPSKLTDEAIEAAEDYIESYKTKYADEIPSAEGLAEVLKTTPQALHRWTRQGQALIDSVTDEETQETDWEKLEELQELDKRRVIFCSTLGKLMAKQKKVLVNNGLNNTFNSNITKLALGNHGMSEKTQNEISGPGGSPVKHDYVIEVIDGTANATNTDT